MFSKFGAIIKNLVTVRLNNNHQSEIVYIDY